MFDGRTLSISAVAVLAMSACGTRGRVRGDVDLPAAASVPAYVHGSAAPGVFADAGTCTASSRRRKNASGHAKSRRGPSARVEATVREWIEGQQKVLGRQLHEARAAREELDRRVGEPVAQRAERIRAQLEHARDERQRERLRRAAIEVHAHVLEDELLRGEVERVERLLALVRAPSLSSQRRPSAASRPAGAKPVSCDAPTAQAT